MSLKGDKYETAEEVKFRLENTIVLYDGLPVYISRVQLPEEEDRNEIARVYFYSLPLFTEQRVDRNKETWKYLSSKKFDLATPKMGYMNHEGEATFVARAPIRQNRQGLCAANLVFTDCRGRKSDRIGWNSITRSQGFVDMLAGKYPSFKEAGELLDNQENSSVAVSRSFAFIMDHEIEALFLMHKGMRCGFAAKGDASIKVPPKFHFLREEMEEYRIPMA